ncbi:MAG: thermonuclease family protein [Reyranella sp.]|nr:thermonuclease family protein [Reyranella sp.]
MKTAVLAAVLTLAAIAPAQAQKGPAGAAKCYTQGALPETLAGIAFAGDGDTIHGAGWSWPVRLWGLQAPELRDRAKADTSPGMRARAHLADVLAAGDHRVTCTPIEFDAYCRVVATCRTGAGVDLTASVLEAGLAYGYFLAKHPSRVDQALAYSKAEAAARKAERGLWPTWLGK